MVAVVAAVVAVAAIAATVGTNHHRLLPPKLSLTLRRRLSIPLLMLWTQVLSRCSSIRRILLPQAEGMRLCRLLAVRAIRRTQMVARPVMPILVRL